MSKSCLLFSCKTSIVQKKLSRGDLTISVLKICSKFTAERPCRSAISIKLLCNFIEITLRHRHFHVNLLHIFRTSFTKNTSGRLPLIAVTTETCRQRCSLKKVFLTVPEIRFIKIARYRPAILLTLS